MSAFAPAGYPNFTGASVNTPTVSNHIATYTNSAGNLSNDPPTAISAGNIQAGISGIAGTLTTYPAAPATGLLVISASSNIGNTVVTITNASMAQTSTIIIPDPGSSTGNIILSNTLTSYTTGQNITGIVNITGTSTSISPLTGSLVVSGGLGLSNNLYVGTSGSVFITRTNDSTSVTSGSLVISGGLGVSGTLYSTYASITNSTIASASITSASITNSTTANASITSATIGNLFVTGSSNLKSLTNTIVQTAHGFSVGNWLYLNGSVYTLALDTSSASSEIVGIVSSIIDANTFSLTMGGLVSGLSGLATGSVYYLGTVSGLMTTLSEATVGSINKPVFVANSSTSGYINNYRGEIIPNSNFNIGSGTIGTFISTIATIGTLNVSTSTIGTLISTTGSIGTLISTTGSIGTLISTIGSVGTLISTTGSVGILISTTGSIGTFISTIGSIGTLILTTGSVGTLISTTGSVGTLISTTGSVGTLISTTGSIGTLISTTGSIGTLISTTSLIGSSTSGTYITNNIISSQSTEEYLNFTTSFTQTGIKLIGSGYSGSSQQGTSVSISSDGNTAVIGAPADFLIGAAWVFIKSGAGFAQLGQKLVGTGYSGNSAQGYSTTINSDGSIIAFSGLVDSSNTGATWIFLRTGSTYYQLGSKLVGSGFSGTSQQGSLSFSIDGSTLAVGSYTDNTNTGAVWIFVKTGSSYIQQGPKLIGSGYSGQSKQGAVSISSDGNTLALGGNTDNSSVGSTWIFVRTNGIWSQQGSKFVGSGYSGSPQQGYSLSISSNGNSLLIGGPTDFIIGACWSFSRTGSQWYQQGSKLVGSGYSGTSQQGFSISTNYSGSTAIIGASGDNGSVGSSWIFTRTNGLWTQQSSKIVGSGYSGTSQQGCSVAIDNGQNILIGGITDNNSSGATWLFQAPVTDLQINGSLVLNGSQNSIYGNTTFQGPVSVATSLVSGSLVTSGNVTVNGTFSSPNPFYSYDVCQGRLTLTSGVAVPTTDITNVGILYFTPYKGSYIALYNGTAWQMYQFSEVSITLTGLVSANNNYDVFANGSGTNIVLSIVAWTNTTTRATGLVLQNGVYVLSGTTTKRYLGSFFQSPYGLSDSLTYRCLWNYYNRTMRSLSTQVIGGASWSYNSTTIRQRNNTQGQSQFVIMTGLSEDQFGGDITVTCNTTNGSSLTVGYGLNSATTYATNCNRGYMAYFGPASFVTSTYRDYLPIGANYVVWNESVSGGTATFYSAGQPYEYQSGMTGSYLM